MASQSAGVIQNKPGGLFWRGLFLEKALSEPSNPDYDSWRSRISFSSAADA